MNMTRGAPCSFNFKQGLQERKLQGHQIDGEKDERDVIQFQVQAGAPGKKTAGAPNWRRKGREGRHAVSSASRGSREENIRGAKLTEKRTRGAPCSFKCKQEVQGRKRQGRQVDGEKDERCAMQFQVHAGAPGKETSGAPNWWKRTRGVPCSFKCKHGLQGRKGQGGQIDGEKENKSLNCQTYFPFDLKIRNIVFLNSIIMMLVSFTFVSFSLFNNMMLVSFTFLLYSTTPRQCRPWSYRGNKARDTVFTNGKRSKCCAPSSPLPKRPGQTTCD